MLGGERRGRQWEYTTREEREVGGEKFEVREEDIGVGGEGVGGEEFKVGGMGVEG